MHLFILHSDLIGDIIVLYLEKNFKWKLLITITVNFPIKL